MTDHGPDDHARLLRLVRYAAEHQGFRRSRDGVFPGHPGIRRLPHGWLGWVTTTPTDDPATGDGARVYLPDDERKSQAWPAWPLHEIEHRLTTATPDDRFPPVVRAHLDTAGWYPGRALPEDLLQTTGTELAAIHAQFVPWQFHDAARTALREFGGLVMCAASSRPISIAPLTDYRWHTYHADALVPDVEQGALMVGFHARVSDAQIAIRADGHCFRLEVETGYAGDLGPTFDEALIRMIHDHRNITLVPSEQESLLEPGDPVSRYW